jgi:flavin-dependent dehydrogenase
VKSKIQNPKPKITIVGAGPAGTSLAIRLARQNVPVTLIEREKFPRHKLCGEFISPECLEHFRDLEVLDEMITRGGDRITKTIFYSENGKNVTISSEWFNGNPDGALGLSRAEMDLRLMERAKDLGVRVLPESAVTGLLFDNQNVCGVEVRNGIGKTEKIFSDLTIDATGRAKVLSKLADKEISRQVAKEQRKKKEFQNPKSKSQKRLVGFKVHLKNVYLPPGRCEIYFFRGGYGGLNYVEDGLANHCFLIKADIVKEFKGDVDRILNEVIFQNDRAREMMKDAEKTFDWLAVSVDGFGVKNLSPAKNLLTVGDAAAFIDPFTGSGMLMAFESAQILAEVIVEDQSAFEAIAGRYQILHRSRFQKRLRVCSLMRRLSFAPKFAKMAISVLSLSERTSEFLARATRQTKIKKA